MGRLAQRLRAGKPRELCRGKQPAGRHGHERHQDELEKLPEQVPTLGRPRRGDGGIRGLGHGEERFAPCYGEGNANPVKDPAHLSGREAERALRPDQGGGGSFARRSAS